MKAVLLSIKPRYCELIANGQKTVEIRKTRPQVKPPFKCYIYMTKDTKKYYYIDEYGDIQIELIPQKIIGEFVCDSVDEYSAEFNNGSFYEDIRYRYINVDGDEQEIIVTSNSRAEPDNCFLCKNSCLTFNDIKRYIGENFHDNPFYTWHISYLKIYDKPRELSEFCKQRPPQSWCYVEEYI